jgi:hypothetical protein
MDIIMNPNISEDELNMLLINSMRIQGIGEAVGMLFGIVSSGIGLGVGLGLGILAKQKFRYMEIGLICGLIFHVISLVALTSESFFVKIALITIVNGISLGVVFLAKKLIRMVFLWANS